MTRQWRAPALMVTLLRGACPTCPLSLRCLGGTLRLDECRTCGTLHHVDFTVPGEDMHEATWYRLLCAPDLPIYGHRLCCALTEKCRRAARHGHSLVKKPRKR